MFRRTRKPATDQSLSLAERLQKAPSLSAPKVAKNAVAELLADSKEPAANALKRLFKQKPVLRLIEGVTEGSPFLWGLIREDPKRLVELLESNPESHFAHLIERMRATCRAAEQETIARELRRMRQEAALLIALADIGGAWSFAEVAQALSAVAEAAVSAAVDFLLLKAKAANQIRLPKPDAPGEGTGFIILGMGKLGGSELNYSSDIDLIVLFDPKAPLANGVEPSSFFVKLTRDLVRLLQERTSDGYVFRVDLRLRPDPGSTQVAIATDAALTYYERSGQTWERAVFIKARAIAGDIAAGEGFLRELSPFVWRRYLDHAAIAEIQGMKQQIHAFRGHGEIAVEGHNIKLGRGGIREIEFFAQTQQLIAGGRASELREKNTLAALDALANGGWIDTKTRDDLATAYVFLREVENRLQMVADEQTHTLPQDPEVFARFARFFGRRSRDDFATLLEGELGRVQTHYSHLFEDTTRQAPEISRLNFPLEKDDRETLDLLAGMGFRDPVAASAAVRGWLSAPYRSLKPEAARADLAAIVPALLAALAGSGDPDAALIACDRFFSELPGGERLFAALRTHPDLVRLLALILGTAPRLGEIVARSPSLLDGLLDPGFFGASPSEEILTARLDALLSRAENEEQAFDRVRRFGREQMVLIGVRTLSGVLSASQAGEAYATLADVVIRALHHEVERRFAEAHGHLRGAETAVLALGKLGGREMTAGSDLDLILLYDFDPKFPRSDGKRPLEAAQYFARLTKRLISALTTPTNEGKLYDVDLRLRPSGRSGPVATGLESFALYQQEKAWTWEHMALTRARVISAAPTFRLRIETLIREILCFKRDPQKIADDVREMRRLIAAEKGEDERWDLKYAKGGLIDIEFIVQYLVLVHAAAHPDILDPNTVRTLERAQSAGILRSEDGELLRAAARLYHDLTQLLRLCLPGRFDPAVAGAALLALLPRAAGLPDFTTLDAHLADTQARVRRLFDEIIDGKT